MNYELINYIRFAPTFHFSFLAFHLTPLRANFSFFTFSFSLSKLCFELFFT